MSWALEDWTAGLPGREREKARELQARLDELLREKKQRQFQLETVEVALHKQRLQIEEERVVAAGLRRELQAAGEAENAGRRARERLSQELQVKDGQVCALEGQLSAAHKQVDSLQQELKRLQAKLQNSQGSGDSVLFSTPSWSPPGLSSPCRDRTESQGDSKDGFQRDRLREQETRGVHVKQLLFSSSDRSLKPVRGGDSSPFPWQQETTPVRRPPRQPEVSVRKGGSSHMTSGSSPSSVFPWEKEKSLPTPRGQQGGNPAPSQQSSSDVNDSESPAHSGVEEDLRKENAVLQCTVLELETWVQALEKEVQAEKSRATEAERALNAQGLSLTQCREELNRCSARAEQQHSQCQSAEQRLKQLAEELNCHRQNSDLARRQAEQRLRQTEKEHQQDLAEQQRLSAELERRHQQESSRLTQELQQARAQHLTLQAHTDKLGLQKQCVERELESVRERLRCTEKELKDSQRREEELQRHLMEVLREKDSVGASLEQSLRRGRSLEEEVNRLTQEVAAIQKLLDDLRALQASPPHVPEAPVRISQAGGGGCSLSPKLVKRRPRSQRSGGAGQRETPTQGREPAEGRDASETQEPEWGGTVTQEEETEEEEGERSQEGRVETEAALCKERETGRWKEGGKEQSEEEEGEGGEQAAREKRGEEVGKATDGELRKGGEEKRRKREREGEEEDQAGQLQRENEWLRGELREARRELELRLEDLEAQRRAEAEARSRLKQAGKRHGVQAEILRQRAQELQEKEARLEAALEAERGEAARLTQALASLETEAAQLKQLRQREEEEEAEAGKESRMQSVRELESGQGREAVVTKADLDARGKADRGGVVTSASHSDPPSGGCNADRLDPHNRREGGCHGTTNTNNNNNTNDEKKDRSDSHCESGVELEERGSELEESREEPDLSQPQPQPQPQPSLSQSEESISPTTASEPETLQDQVTHCPADKNKDMDREGLDRDEDTKLSDGRGEEDGGSLLEPELEQLRRRCDSLDSERRVQEGRAREAEERLQSLQSLLSAQTQQLTLAFDSQALNIEALLEDLQTRDSALHRLGEELQGCRAELSRLVAENEQLRRFAGPGAGSEREWAQLGAGEKGAGGQGGRAVVRDEELRKTLAAVLPPSSQGEPPLPEKEAEQLTGIHGGPHSSAESQTVAPESSRVIELLESHQAAVPPPSPTGKPVREASLVRPEGEQDGTIQRLVEELQRELSLMKTEKQKLRTMLGQEGGENSSGFLQPHIKALQQELQDLRSLVSSLSEDKCRLGAELLQWRAQGDAIAPSTAGGAVVVVREDRLLLPCRAGRLVQSIAGDWPSEPGVLANVPGITSTTAAEQQQAGPSSGHPHPEDRTPGSLRVTWSSPISIQIQSAAGKVIEEPETKATDCRATADQTEAIEDTIEDNQAVDNMANETKAIHSRTQGGVASVTEGISQDGQAKAVDSRETQAKVPDHRKRQSETGLSNQTEAINPEQLLLPIPPSQTKAETNDNRTKATEQLATTQIPASSSDHSSQAGAIKTQTSESQIKVADLDVVPQLAKTIEIGDVSSHIAVKESKETGSETEGEAAGPQTFGEQDANQPDSPCRRKDHTTAREQKEEQETTERDGGDPDLSSPCEPEPRTADTEREWSPEVQHSRDLRVAPAQIETAEVQGIDAESSVEMGGLRTSPDTTQKETTVSMAWATTATQTVTPCGREVGTANVATQTDMTAETEPDTEQDAEAQVEGAGGGQSQLFAQAFPLPADPAQIAERIRRNRGRMSAAFDDTEYEPYGLPEVVMKGFADIPSGPACPYVLRRGLLGTATLPSLQPPSAPAKDREPPPTD